MMIELKMFWDRWSEKFLMFLAWYTIPKVVRRWVVIRAFVDATLTHSDLEPDEVGYSKVMNAMR